VASWAKAEVAERIAKAERIGRKIVSLDAAARVIPGHGFGHINAGCTYRPRQALARLATG
jgi:hypothetical protein